MTLNEFKSLLEANRGKEFRLQLPDQTAVPVSFHITEVAHVQKKFIDCGGTMREQQTCQLQAWVGPDEDHRIASGKMAEILNKASSFLPGDDLPLEIEYEDVNISQYAVAEALVSDDAVTLQLATKHTACLAPELCIAPGAAIPLAACGCGPAGCC
jgi:hypothetical protein